jgi:hypothetical protein
MQQTVSDVLIEFSAIDPRKEIDEQRVSEEGCEHIFNPLRPLCRGVSVRWRGLSGRAVRKSGGGAMSADVIAVNNQRIGGPLHQEYPCRREVVFAVVW